MLSSEEKNTCPTLMIVCAKDQVDVRRIEFLYPEA